jgi:hypothetical protein
MGLSLPAPAPVRESSATSLQRAADGSWQLLLQGTPFLIQGAGGGGRYELLAALGGNTVRTWHTHDSAELDEAHAHGLAVMAGLSVAHERHGFDYSDQGRVARQRAEILDIVRRVKNHPALLIWGLGNETEGFERPEGNPLVWRELDTLARLIKAEDPHHPVCTVIAGPGEAKLASFEEYCPHVDILGINAYGDARLAPDALAHASITRPFLLTEFGPSGHWEARATPWGAPIEPSAQEKARSYLATHREVMAQSRGRCLGTLAFLWGHKQEVTPTWYGMFLPTGEKTAAVDAMAVAWSGKNPAESCPRIVTLSSPLVEAVTLPGREYEVQVELVHPSRGRLELEWRLLAESTDRKIGGDPEKVPPEFPEAIVATGLYGVTVRAPAAPGAYRLFLYVRDGLGAGATANFPFLVLNASA